MSKKTGEGRRLRRRGVTPRRESRPLGRALRCVLALVLALGPATAHAADLDAATGLKLERVVLLMRHGIRPPIKATVTPPGIAAAPWPKWEAPYGHLTAHGAVAIRRLGRFDRESLAARGLLPGDGCPKAGTVAVWSDTDQRTIATGDALLDGMFPGCGIRNSHLAKGARDPLFSPYKDGVAVDAAAARAAILARVGSLERLRSGYSAAFDRLQQVLGCCAPVVCQAAALPAGCRMAELPGDIAPPKPGDGRPDMTGLFDFAPSAAQTLMLEYAEGKKQVGWGRVNAADLELIGSLHALKGDLLQRPALLGAHGATRLARRMLEAIERADGPLLTVLVGHDTNIGDLSGLLAFDWQVTGYAANTPPPGGGVGFELLADRTGARYVRVFYRSQTLQQMRELTRLDAAHPAFRQALTVPGCAMPDDATRCQLDAFAQLVRGKLIPGE
jgi:4-phytase/acid phosphatase